MILSFAAALAVAGLVSCGGDSVRNSDRRDPVVLRVGDVAVSMPTFAHWMRVMAPQHVVPDPPRYTACIAREQAFAPHSTGGGLKEQCRQQYQALRQQVLDFLITSQWLIGEAADEGLTVSEQDVNRRFAVKRASFASAAEFQESLKAIAHTVADMKLEIQAELAAERIRRRLDQGEAKVTHSEIADYYRRHIKSYHVPEMRYFDIGENFRTAAKARSKAGEVKAGRESLHESLPRKSFTDFKGEKRTIYEAIFKAKLDEVSAPIRLNNLYFLIHVTRITPPYVQSLAQVQHAIGEKLTSDRRHRTHVAFIAAWRSRWIARTGCSAGYVVQKCRQYSGPKALEDPLRLT